MTNGDKLAFPFEGGANNGILPSGGLTKREYFAAMAMQGICANSQENSPAGLWEVVAADAVKVADELLKALENWDD